MTRLRDHFEVTHKKDQFTYVQWSQVADRLDDVCEADDNEWGCWSFAIIGFDPGGEWAHGRLTMTLLNGTSVHFENIGYAENVAAEWKKEPLKDAVSDAFKRCAALAGVARYLYDKDSPRTAPARQERPQTPAPVQSRPQYRDEDEANPFDSEPTPIRTGQRDSYITCPEHGVKWAGEPGDLFHRLEAGGYCRHPENVKKARAR